MCVCPCRGWTASGITASNSPFGLLYVCDGEKPTGTCLCVYLPYLGPGTHSWFGQWGEGFLIF